MPREACGWLEKKAKSSLGSWLCRRRTISEEMGLFQRLRDTETDTRHPPSSRRLLS